MNSVLVLFSRSREFIPGITFKDVQRFEERNKNGFFYSEGNLTVLENNIKLAI